jgi:hypothetical protein
VLNLDLQTEAEDVVVAIPMVDAAEEEAPVNHGRKPSPPDGIKVTKLPA